MFICKNRCDHEFLIVRICICKSSGGKKHTSLGISFLMFFLKSKVNFTRFSFAFESLWPVSNMERTNSFASILCRKWCVHKSKVCQNAVFYSFSQPFRLILYIYIFLYLYKTKDNSQFNLLWKIVVMFSNCEQISYT